MITDPIREAIVFLFFFCYKKKQKIDVLSGHTAQLIYDVFDHIFEFFKIFNSVSLF